MLNNSILEVSIVRTSILTVALVFLLSSVTALGQTFTMTGSSASFVNLGNMVFTSDDGQFQTDQNSVGNVDNSSGTISFEGQKADATYFSTTLGGDGTGSLGFDSNTRVTGWVSYSSDAGGTQQVQNRYYSSMEADGSSSKEFIGLQS